MPDSNFLKGCNKTLQHNDCLSEDLVSNAKHNKWQYFINIGLSCMTNSVNEYLKVHNRPISL